MIPSETDVNAMIKKLEDMKLLGTGLQIAMENPDFKGMPQTKRAADYTDTIEYQTNETNKVVFNKD